MQRRLSAILFADVVGYSKLMSADERGAFKMLEALRKTTLEPAMREKNGNIVKGTGDGLLAEFASVVDAVECAAAIQTDLFNANSSVKLRIGVNLGDIIFTEDDIYGDGVNIAARLESEAAPGGLCISGSAYEHVCGKLDIAFESQGQQQLKNI